MANQEITPFVLAFPNGQRVEDILKKADQLPTKAQLDQELAQKATTSYVERETQQLQNQINEIVNLEQIVFATRSNFPEIGKAKVLYVATDECTAYLYSEQSYKYECINGDYTDIGVIKSIL